MLAGLSAAIRINGSVTRTGPDDANIRIVTENAAFARNIFTAIRRLYGSSPEVTIRRSRKLKKHIMYILVITAALGAGKLLEDIKYPLLAQNPGKVGDAKTNALLKRNCCKRTYLRWAFLSGGSVSDPEKTYHLELNNHRRVFADELKGLMDGFKLHARMIRRKGNYVIYLKEGENIVDFLNIVGAHNALLELENVRILKEMRNNVNRIVNCETANLEKTVNASIRQVENIKYIKESIGFQALPRNLREIAEIRLEYSDANLKELGEMLDPPLGKSGVNHRLRKLDAIAEKERESRGEH